MRAGQEPAWVLLMEGLRHVRKQYEEGGLQRDAGICHNLRMFLYSNGLTYSRVEGALDLLNDTFSVWGLDRAYPVACPGYESNMYAYDRVDDLWVGEYGANRVALLDRLIEHFTKIEETQ